MRWGFVADDVMAQTARIPLVLRLPGRLPPTAPVDAPVTTQVVPSMSMPKY